MSKNNKSNTDLQQFNDLQRIEDISPSTDMVSQPLMVCAAWKTRGQQLGVGSPLEPAAATISVLPRRMNEEAPRDINCQYHEELLQDLQHRIMDVGDIEEPRHPVIGRDHPASSQAALAGYRYRTRG